MISDKSTVAHNKYLWICRSYFFYSMLTIYSLVKRLVEIFPCTSNFSFYFFFPCMKLAFVSLFPIFFASIFLIFLKLLSLQMAFSVHLSRYSVACLRDWLAQYTSICWPNRRPYLLAAFFERDLFLGEGLLFVVNDLYVCCFYFLHNKTLLFALSVFCFVLFGWFPTFLLFALYPFIHFSLFISLSTSL